MYINVLILDNNDDSFSLITNQLLQLNFAANNIHRGNLLPNQNLPVEDIDLIIIHFESIENVDHCLNQATSKYFNIPILIIADVDDEKLALHTLTLGVQDCLIKDHYTLKQLETTITYAIARNKADKKAVKNLLDYKRHFDNGPIPMWIVNRDTMQFMEVNKATVEKYGYTRDEFLKMSLLDIRPDEDKPNMAHNYHSNLTDYFDAGYWRHIRKNGEVFWVHVYSHNAQINDVDARISFVVDVNEKINTQKQNQELTQLLKEQKDKLDSLLYSISDAIWSRNAKTLDLIYANNACFELFGFTNEALLADSDLFYKHLHPDDIDLFKNAMHQTIQRGTAAIEYRYCHTNGDVKTLQAHVTFKEGENGEPDTLNGVTVDVSAARMMENKIRQSEQNLLATINNTKDLIWSVNTKLEIIFCNLPYQDFIYKLTEKVPKAGDYVLGEWGSDAFIQNRKKDYERALKGETFITIVEEIYDGDILYKEFSNNPIIDHEGNITGVNCIARDISEQKRQFLKIQEQNETLKEIANIQSHNVRGPVASILGLAELFVIDPDDAHNTEILENLKIATTQLDAIIREVVKKTVILKKNK